MPVDLRDLDDEHMAQLAWAENQQRRDITAIEQAEAIERMMTSFGWSQQEVAERLGLARPTVANKLRLLKLPEDVRAQLRAGVLAERQAAALIPLFELPPDRLKALQRESFLRCHPDEIVRNAPTLSSDSIRGEVRMALRQISNPLPDGEFTTHAFADYQARKFHAPLCYGCKQSVEDGARCLDVACFNAKLTAWREARVTAASAATGIPPRDAGSGADGRHFAGLPAAEIKAIVERPCVNLRLLFRRQHLHHAPRLADFPDVALACTKGAKCKCLAEYEARAWPGQPRPRPAASLSDAARSGSSRRPKSATSRRRSRSLIPALQSDELGAWRKLARLVNSDLKKADDLDLAGCRQAIARGILRSQMGWSWQNEPDLLNIRDTVEAAVTALGLPAPWELPPVELLDRRLRQARAHIERIIGWTTTTAPRHALAGFEQAATTLAADADAVDPGDRLQRPPARALLRPRSGTLCPLPRPYYVIEDLLDAAPTSAHFQATWRAAISTTCAWPWPSRPTTTTDRQAAILTRLADLGWQPGTRHAGRDPAPF